MIGISQSLIESSRKRIEQETERANREQAIAELFDKHVTANQIEVKDPEYIHTSKLYGAIGSIAWDDATPEDAVKIMEAFPPVPSGLCKGTFTSYIPEAAREKEKDQTPGKFTPGDVFSPGDGYTIRLDGGATYPVTVKVSWYTEIEGKLLGCDVKLLSINDVTPRIRIDATHNPDGSIIRITNCSIIWPVKLGWALQTIRYASGSPKSVNPFLVWAHDGGPDTPKPILETVKAWAQVCFEKRQHSRRAYELDKANGLRPEPAERETYESQSLKIGTKAQWEALRTEEARADQALAKRHWLDYIADGDPSTFPSRPSEYRKYFYKAVEASDSRDTSIQHKPVEYVSAITDGDGITRQLSRPIRLL